MSYKPFFPIIVKATTTMNTVMMICNSRWNFCTKGYNTILYNTSLWNIKLLGDYDHHVKNNCWYYAKLSVKLINFLNSESGAEVELAKRGS